MSTLKKAAYHTQRFFFRIHDDHLFHLSASLAYSTLLTLVPFLIERPIVYSYSAARLCRPPELVLEVLL